MVERRRINGVPENRDEIPVGDPDADMKELRAIFGAEKVARSLRVWNMLIQKTTSQPSFLVNSSWGDARPGLEG